MDRREAQILHLAGLDQLPAAFDPQPFGAVSDPELAAETPQIRSREHLPQLGPMFVEAVMQRFTELERRMTEALERWSYKPVTDTSIAAFVVDGSGNVRRTSHQNSVILDPPPGFTMALHRLVIFSPTAAFTFGAPYTAAGAFWELRVNDEMVDGGSLVSGQGSLPVAKSWGTRDAPRCRDGEVGSIFISGGAGLANTSVAVKAQYTMERNVEG